MTDDKLVALHDRLMEVAPRIGSFLFFVGVILPMPLVLLDPRFDDWTRNQALWFMGAGLAGLWTLLREIRRCGARRR